ncbi:MAG TPA: PKD domain-containing protein [Acidobacteriota bacterium]|nr:PKD domain-containing protein [Acidobacteriota bacterium]
MRSHAFRPLLLAVSVAALLATIRPLPADAQYLFLDADGDSLNNHGYEYSNADTATIDVYIVTDRNPDGSPAVCESGDGTLDLWGYTVSLATLLGPFTLVSVENPYPQLTASFPPDVHPYGMTLGYAGSWTLPPGIHRLLRLRLVFVGYGGNLVFVQESCHTLPGVGTTISTLCPGADADFTMPIEGIGMGYFTDVVNRRPTVSAPDTVAAREGEPISFTVEVTDPECGQGTYLFSYWVSGVPTGAVASGLAPFVYGETTSTFDWTPAIGQAGTYSVEFMVHDPDTWNWWIDPDVEDTTIIRVAPADPLSANGPPTASAGGPYAALQDVPIKFQGAGSSDPDGDVLAFAWWFGDSATAAGPTVEHAYSAAGVYGVVLTVTDGEGLADTDQTTATITAGPPVEPSLIGSIAPNPVTDRSVMEFTTTREGHASVRLFDVRGRLVARAFESPRLGAGTHRIPGIGAAGSGSTLPSGVYFLRLVTEHDGEETRRVTLLH